MKTIVFTGGQILVDGSVYNWLDLTPATHPANWVVVDYVNQCTTIKSTAINGAPALIVDVEAKP